MRIYFDSNIFRKIRPASRQFDPKLFEAVETLRNALIFVFSDAHLSDLSKSDLTYREIDFNHMETYVGTNFFSFDHVYKKFNVYIATPCDAYGSTDFQSFEKAVENPLEFIDNLFNQDETAILKPLMDTLLNTPIFDNIGQGQQYSSLTSPEIISALSNIRTMKDALTATAGLGGFLTSKTEFAKIQDFMRSQINRDDYSFDIWSFEFDQKMKETALGKSFSEMVEIVNTGTSKEDTYNRFINFYTHLEFLGVTTERVGGKRKKNSLLEIQRDAAHAYFASMTDYFVSDDQGLLKKSFITYRMFGINTEVLSVNDFIFRSKLLLNNEEDLSSFCKGVKFSLKNGFVLHQAQLTGDRVIKLQYPVMNYFNRLQFGIYGDVPGVVLFRSAQDGHGMMWAEFDLLVTKCTNLFGLPSDRKQRRDIHDYEKEEGALERMWTLNNSDVILDLRKTSHAKSVITLEIIFNK